MGIDSSSQGYNVIQPGIPREILQLLLDSSVLLERIEHGLKGEIMVIEFKKDAEGNTVLDANSSPIPEVVWKELGKRCMNDEGVRNVMSKIDTYINPTSQFTSLTEEEIRRKMIEIDDNLAGMFYLNVDAWGIDKNTWTSRKNDICNLCHFAMNKSLNAKLMETMLKSWQITEDRTQQPRSSGLTDTLLAIPRALSPQR